MTCVCYFVVVVFVVVIYIYIYKCVMNEDDFVEKKSKMIPTKTYLGDMVLSLHLLPF